MSDYLQKYNKYGGGHPDNKIKIVYGLDINGTIVVGDTFHDNITIKLTDEMLFFFG